MEIKLRKIGNSVGATFPKEILDRFNLKEGDQLSLLLLEDGIKLIPYDPNIENVVAAYKQGASKYRNVMRELADG